MHLWTNMNHIKMLVPTITFISIVHFTNDISFHVMHILHIFHSEKELSASWKQVIHFLKMVMIQELQGCINIALRADIHGTRPSTAIQVLNVHVSQQLWLRQWGNIKPVTVLTRSEISPAPAKRQLRGQRQQRSLWIRFWREHKA